MLAVYLQLFLPWSLTTSLKYFSHYPSAPANTVSNIKRRRLSEERNTTRTVSLMVEGAVKLRILHQSEIVCWHAWRCISGRFDNFTCESTIVTLLLLLLQHTLHNYISFSVFIFIMDFCIYFRQFGFLIPYPFVFQLSFVFYNFIIECSCIFIPSFYLFLCFLPWFFPNFIRVWFALYHFSLLLSFFSVSAKE